MYAVREEEGVRFLHAAAKGLGIQAAKEIAWDLNAYPVLAWSWRPVEFPKGGDERQSSTNDSALAVYMLMDYSQIRGPKAVKYVSSERVPVGTHLTSNMGLTQVRILRNGAPDDRKWVEERVNVRDDFKKYFSQSETAEARRHCRPDRLGRHEVQRPGRLRRLPRLPGVGAGIGSPRNDARGVRRDVPEAARGR